MDLRSIVEFEAKWERNTVRPHNLLMILDASEAVLKTKFSSKEVTSRMIVEFSKVVSEQMEYDYPPSSS